MDLNTLLILTSVSMLLSAGAFLFCFLHVRQLTKKLVDYSTQVAELQDSLESNQEQFEAVLQKNADAMRRIAWLETRVRQPAKAVEKPAELEPERTVGGTFRPEIAERRRRVLTLAERGQRAETIAATLGMLSGEVELILNLSRATA